jgi:hypothetical protein
LIKPNYFEERKKMGFDTLSYNTCNIEVLSENVVDKIFIECKKIYSNNASLLVLGTSAAVGIFFYLGWSFSKLVIDKYENIQTRLATIARQTDPENTHAYVLFIYLYLFFLFFYISN